MGVTISCSCATPTSALHLYVSGINGNDANSGLNPAQPLATVLEAVRRFGDVDRTVIVHIGAQGGSGYAPPEIIGRVAKANLYFYGDGAGQPGETGFVTILATEPATAGSGTSAVVATSGLVTNAYRGMTIEIVTGAAAGNRRTIRNNTTTTIVPVRPFTAAVSPGDTFRVVDPSVVWDFPAGDTLLLSSFGAPQSSDAFNFMVSPACYYVNLKWTSSGVASAGLAMSRAVMVNVVSDTTDAFTFSSPALSALMSSDIQCGIDAFPISPFAEGLYAVVDDLGVATAQTWLGWGLAFRSVAALGTTLSCAGQGYIVAPQMQFGFGALYYLRGGNFFAGSGTNGAVLVTNGARVRIQGTGGIDMLFAANSTTGCVVAQRGGQIFTLLAADVQNVGGPAIAALDGGEILVVGATGSGSTFGTLAYTGGFVDFSGAPAVTGSTADLSLDNATGVPNATLGGSGQGISDGISRIVRG